MQSGLVAIAKATISEHKRASLYLCVKISAEAYVFEKA